MYTKMKTKPFTYTQKWTFDHDSQYIRLTQNRIKRLNIKPTTIKHPQENRKKKTGNFCEYDYVKIS